MHSHPRSFFTALGACAVIAAGSAHAAPITWGSAIDVAATTDVSTNGILVEAYNLGKTGAPLGSVTVNTVTFAPLLSPAPLTATNTNPYNQLYGNSSGNADYDNLLNSIAYGGGAGLSSLSVGGGSLINGTTYGIQLWFVEERLNDGTGADVTGRVMQYGDGSGNTVNLGGTAGLLGQYVTGTFIADGANQTITMDPQGFGNSHLTAYQIRAISEPPAPDIPVNLTATPADGRISLDWSDNNQFGFAHFIVRRAENAGGPYTDIAMPTASQFTDLGLTNGVTYHYVVAARNSLGQVSADSDEASATPAAVPEPPNFLFIITDDQDTYSINAYRRTEPAEQTAGGQPYVVDTPNIDRLADEGMLFHQARLMGAWAAAVCTASRTCIMTGRNTWGAKADYDGAGSAANTFPGIFNRGVRSGLPALPHATYRTCKVGNSYPRANAEFTIVNDATKRGNTDGQGSEWHADRALDHLEHWRTNHRPNGKPFLMYLGFSHPHDERLARTTPDLTGRYGCFNTTSPGTIPLNPLSPPLPLNHLPVNEALGIPANYPFHPFDHGHLTVRDEVDTPGFLQYRTEAVVRNEIGRNFACVDWIDRQLGRVLAKLEDPDGDGDTADSVLDNTYIVFTSDHGIAIGRHGLEGKQNLYEHSWRVPYIVRGPGIAAGSETDALIYLHDTFPTFCDLAGLNLPPTIDNNDGASFRAVLEGSQDTTRDYVYGLYAGGDLPGMRSITDGRFKLIKYDVADNAVQVTQMFDLETNPFELLDEHGVPNIATLPAYAGIRQRLEEALMRQRIENADPYAFLGDRTLLRFEDGPAGQPAGVLADRLPFGNDGTAASGNGGSLPLFSVDVPGPTDDVIGEANTHSLDFEAADQNYVQVPDAGQFDFGDAPFTIEAWVKLESLPTGANLESCRPVAMKKAIGSADNQLDYMFLAAAGSYGDASTYANLALHLGSGVVVSDLSIPDTGWHHISAAFDPVANIVRFTLDDQTDTKATTFSGTVNNGPLVIGAHFNASGTIDAAFDGLIDEFSITNGFLDAAELQPLRNVTAPQPFRVLDFELNPGGNRISLTFESDDTHLYAIQRSATLGDGSWTPVRSFVPGASGAIQTTVADLPVTPNATREFFRVVQE